MADVGVAVVDLVDDLIEIAVIVKVGESPAVFEQLWDLVFNRISGNIADLVAVHVLTFSPFVNGVYASFNVHAARVGADTDMFVPGFFAGLLEDAVKEVRSIAFGGVFDLLLGHD